VRSCRHSPPPLIRTHSILRVIGIRGGFSVLLDYLIGLREERGGNVDAQGLGSPQVDGEFEGGGGLNGHFTRWRATKETGDKVGNTPLESGSIHLHRR
jgi:hypothetical protein